MLGRYEHHDLERFNDGTLEPEYDRSVYPDFEVLHLVCRDCEAEYPYDEGRREHENIVSNYNEAEHEKACERRAGGW